MVGEAGLFASHEMKTVDFPPPNPDTAGTMAATASSSSIIAVKLAADTPVYHERVLICKLYQSLLKMNRNYRNSIPVGLLI